MKKIGIIAALAMAITAPALAQNSADSIAKAMATGNLNLKAWPVGVDVPIVDQAKDPWIAMSSSQMAATQPASERKKAYGVSAQLDYNADGVMDIAYMANNKTQAAVLVRLGNNKGTVVAFRAKKRWAGGQEIAAGGRRIFLSYPESSVVILSAESGHPAVYYVDDGG